MIDTTAALVWRTFLGSIPEDQQHHFLACLTQETLSFLGQFHPLHFDLAYGVDPVESALDQIDGSWFAPFLRTLSENEIRLFLSSLTESQVDPLRKQLLFTSSLLPLTSVGKQYLRKTLFDALAEEPLVPISCLPGHPLNALLILSAEEFSSLFSLLSMHDLSIEVRQIIETAKLKEIYAVLTKPQTNLLKTLLHKKETVSFKKMGLAHWQGEREALKALLLQRGVNRVAKALFGHDPSLIWYVAHRLDREKGKMLLELCTPLDHPKAASYLTEQILELIQAIQHPNPLYAS